MKILKRLSVTAREFHVLLRETLLALGWLDMESDPGAGSFGLLSSGADGETDSSTPTTFSAASGAFTPVLVGKYLVLGGPATPAAMRGIHRIVATPNGTTLTVASGLYGSSFSTALNVPWRIVDPTLNTDATFFVVQGPSGTSTPAWQVHFYLNLADTDVLRYDVGPFGGWSVGIGWTGVSTALQATTADATQVWYATIQDEAITLFTETVGGGSVFNVGYAGTGIPRAPAVDDHFAVAFGGAGIAGLNAISSIGTDNATTVDYQALAYRSSATAVFPAALPNSPFDLRRDLAEIAVGRTTAPLTEDDRGTLRGIRYVSTLVPYRSFVDNGRQWVSLGSGIAVQWDGSVSA